MTATDASSSGGGGGGGGNPSDPSGFVTSPPSTMVKVINTARAEVNGTVGVVLSYNSDRGRYNVSLLPGQSPAAAAAGNAAAGRAGQPSVMSFKPENLSPASAVEKAKAQGLVALDRIKRMAADPDVREQARRAYASLQARLPPGVKVEHAAVALLALWWISVWFIGFSKTVMITSITGLVLSVCLQDILAGCDVKTIARNFPNRWREAIVQTTGFNRVTEKTALAGFVVVMLLSAKVVMTPTAKRAPKASPVVEMSSTAGDGTMIQPGQQSRDLKVPAFDIEEVYKLGFDDAKAGKDYWASMPDPADVASAETSAASAGRGVDYDPREWDLNPPPQPEGEKKSKFGFGTIMAAFTLFRFGKEIAINPEGEFDQQMALANLNMMPKWKLGIVALCLYNIVSGLSGLF